MQAAILILFKTYIMLIILFLFSYKLYKFKIKNKKVKKNLTFDIKQLILLPIGTRYRDKRRFTT